MYNAISITETVAKFTGMRALHCMTSLLVNTNPTSHSLFAITSEKVKVGYSHFMIIMAVIQLGFNKLHCKDFILITFDVLSY